MSRQEINLLAPEASEESQPIQALQVLIVVGVLVVALGGLSALDWMKVDNLQASLLETRAQVARLSQTTERLQALVGRDVDAEVQAEVERLRQTRDGHAALEQLLSDRDEAAAGRFSSVLLDLARQDSDGLWLTEISIAAGGDSLRLRGVAASGARVPRFVRALGSTASMRGQRFSSMVIVDAEDAAGLHFEITGPTQRPSLSGGT